jgi:Domain of unknown function (DUF4375)
MELRADLGPTIYEPTSEDICAACDDYLMEYIFENRRITDAIDASNSLAEVLHHMTEGQRLAYLLGIFDGELTNGGVAQFLFNQLPLVEDVLDALQAMKLVRHKDMLAAVVREYSVPPDEPDLSNLSGEEARRAFISGMRKRIRQSEISRKAIEHLTTEFEQQYFNGPLQMELCAALNAYFKRYPEQFQVLGDSTLPSPQE